MSDQREIRITPKAIGVLCALAERSGQVVSKQELFRIVWPKSVVTDATLASCIQELRRALHDDARTPRYIETIHRRGFRFLVPTSSLTPALEEASAVIPASAGREQIVGREAAIQKLANAAARAMQGRRQIVFVCGEAGIGKTALADLFLHRLSSASSCAITRSECVQHYGPGEAYQPVLEMLMRLAQPPFQTDLVRTLRRLAPLWLEQLPALQSASEAEALHRRNAGATPERMLRELTDALEALAEQTPLVLCIEDLHWSDPSTLDWIACFARRPERARVLILGTYRPGESANVDGLPDRLVSELHARDRCALVELAPLDEGAVVTYVTQRFPPAASSEHAIQTLARTVHERTEGNPLFVVSVLDELLARGSLTTSGGKWQVEKPIHAGESVLSPDLRRTLEQQIVRLSGDVRTLLEAASVLGVRFPAAAIAAAADVPVVEAERKLSDLARRRTLLREVASTSWPDGTVCATFEFAHALYADALRGLLSPSRLAELHRALGLRLEAAYGRQALQAAAELAMHFDRGRDFLRAIRFHEHAAQNNLRRSAHASAQGHFARALQLLEHIEASPLRDELEINLHLGLGNVLMQTGGWAAADVQAAYARASDLCHRHGATPRLFPALWNLWIFNAASGCFDQAHALALQLQELAHSSNDAASMLQAHHANWTTLYSIGDLNGCAAHANQGIALHTVDHIDNSTLEYGSHDCGVCARMFNARTLALFGESTAARRHVHDALDLAERLQHPFTQAFALAHAAVIHLELGDAIKCRMYGESARLIAQECQFRLLDAWAGCYIGASLTQLGEPAKGLSMIQDESDRARATGSNMFQSHLLGLLAAAQLRNGHIDDGLRSVEHALAMSVQTGERFYLAELHRIKGELHMAQGAAEQSRTLAARELNAALTTARSQGALLPAQRASAALARL